MEITLTEQELAFAVGVALARQDGKKYKAENYAENLNGLAVDICGFLGELAFAKACNMYPDTEIKQRDSGYDFFLLGKTIDVKTTMYKNPKYLYVNCNLESYPNIFVLASVNPGDLKKVELIGYTTKSNVMKATRNRNEKTGHERYEIAVESLFNIYSFVEQINSKSHGGNS